MSKVNSSALFNNAGFRLSLLRGFNSKTNNIYLSNNNVGGKATLHRPSLKALVAYCCNGYAVWDETLSSDEIFNSIANSVSGVAKIDNLILAEYQQSDDNKHLACFDLEKQQFLFAGTTSDNGKSWEPYILDYEDGRNGTVLWLAMIPYLADANEEMKAIIYNLMSFGNDSINGNYTKLIKGEIDKLPRSVKSQCFLFCDAVYHTVDRDNFQDSIPCGIPKGDKPVFPRVPDDLSVYKPLPKNVLSGHFTLMSLSEKSTTRKKKTFTADDLFCMYPLNENMTDDERACAARMYPSYVVPTWVMKAAHNIQFHHRRGFLSQELKQNNLFLFGPPGSGKTDGSKAIASALGLPFTHISISSNSDESVFVGNIIPEVDGVSSDSNSSRLSFESVLDKYKDTNELAEAAYMMPEVVYEDITGKSKEDASVADCWEAWHELLSSKETKSSGNSSGIRYKFVESSFCKAIEQGWLVTIEEFTNARDTGIGIIINQLMDGYQEISLPTGKKIRRHPNCVIVFASNVDEAQCGEFEASTLSRLKPMYNIAMPSKGDIIKRVKAQTGFNDDSILNQMADVVVALQKYVKEHALVGVCGVREFIGWVLQFEANKEFAPDLPQLRQLYNSAMETIVPSASPHEEDIVAITRDIIDTMIK